MRPAAPLLAFALWLGCLAPLWAQQSPAEAALAARAKLEEAARTLANAGGGHDRVRALTGTVRAYEDGLTALRDGLRRAAIREAALSRELQVKRDEIARLLGVLQTMGRAPAPLLLLHPTGPLGTARSGMILSDITPALQQEAEALRLKLEEVTLLRTLQETAADTLQDGLDGAQAARTALAKAIADREDLPKRFTEDPLKMALLIASTETLAGFASGLSQVTLDDDPGAAPRSVAQKGALALPVQGRILRGYNEADAAGIARPGLIVATRPRALVTTPAAATIRYLGPLLDYGNVTILEPAPDVLIVLAGMEQVFGETGEILDAGAPVGLMPGEQAEVDGILTDPAGADGSRRSETLYIEVREGQDPVDPATWFATTEE